MLCWFGVSKLSNSMIYSKVKDKKYAGADMGLMAVETVEPLLVKRKGMCIRI